MLKNLLCFLIVINATLIAQNALPKDVFIIGGGPTGLAAAIEAKATGANVTVIEKREHYTREQYVFLMEPALNLLDKWGVFIPELVIGYENEEKVGAMKIKNLEEGLAQRVAALGIPKIIGEFQGLGEKTILVSQQDRNIELSYDFLVAADGTHSAVRNHLNIPLNVFGKTCGAIGIFSISEKNVDMEFILPFSYGAHFLTKITIPFATIISIQGSGISKELLASIAAQLGWQKEAELVSTDSMNYTDNIEIVLQQAHQFSDNKKSVILLGDAAASASFLQGMGANTALESVVMAGVFFNTQQEDTDYIDFNHAMKKITDQLIQESLFLFN